MKLEVLGDVLARNDDGLVRFGIARDDEEVI